MTREYPADSERARHLARAWGKLTRAVRVKHTPPATLAAMLTRAADMFAARGAGWALHAELVRARARELEETMLAQPRKHDR